MGDKADKSLKEKGKITVEDFEKLEIPAEVMREGLLFIWVEKEHIFRIITALEKQ